MWFGASGMAGEKRDKHSRAKPKREKPLDKAETVKRELTQDNPAK
jgi:hypothetical protein